MVANRVTGYRFHSEVVFTVRMQAFVLAGAQVFRTESGALLTQQILTPEFLVEARSSNHALLWRQQFLSDKAVSSRRENSANAAPAETSAAVGQPLPAEQSAPESSDSQRARATAFQQALEDAERRDQEAKQAADVAIVAESIN